MPTAQLHPIYLTPRCIHGRRPELALVGLHAQVHEHLVRLHLPSLPRVPPPPRQRAPASTALLRASVHLLPLSPASITGSHRWLEVKPLHLLPLLLQVFFLYFSSFDYISLDQVAISLLSTNQALVIYLFT